MKIIVRINGGLGNQLFQLAIGYAISKKKGCELKIDNSIFPAQALRNFQLNFFNFPLVIASKSECLSLGAPLNFLNKLLLKFINKKSSYLEEKKSFIYDNRIEQIKTSTYLDGHWQNLSYFQEYQDDLIKLITPNIDYSVDYNKYLSSIKLTESVSIHVRRGDYVDNSVNNSIYNVCDINYYIKSVKFIKENIQNPNFFVFSDDIEWCQKHFSFIENKIFITDTNSLLEDFQLIRNCKSHINPNSTFSWWASWLNINKGGFKFCTIPREWKIGLKTKNLNLKTPNMFEI